jgi:hypothetical protein
MNVATNAPAGYVVTWSVADTTVALVSRGGVLTARRIGRTLLEAEVAWAAGAHRGKAGMEVVVNR